MIGMMIRGWFGWQLVRLVVVVLLLAAIMGWVLGCASSPLPAITPGTSQEAADAMFRRAWPPFTPIAVELLPNGTIREVHERKDIMTSGMTYVVTYTAPGGTITDVHYYGCGVGR